MLGWVFAGLLTISSTQILLHRRLLMRFPLACEGYKQRTYRDYWLDDRTGQ